jgi:hypothetical protein
LLLLLLHRHFSTYQLSLLESESCVHKFFNCTQHFFLVSRRRRTEEEDDDDEEINNSRDFEEFLSFLQLHHNYHLQSTTPPRKIK